MVRILVFIFGYVLAQRCLVLLWPVGEFIGIEFRATLQWIIAGPHFEFYLLAALPNLGLYWYWLSKHPLWSTCCFAILLGAYHSLLFIPYDMSRTLEALVLSTDSSLVFVALMYFFLLIVIPAFVLTLHELVIQIALKQTPSLKNK
tara:strand:- start:611 stop:1048 length:438 start_codon:yes stop_codon:yes gene_type:complete